MVKPKLHTNNKHKLGYNFEALCDVYPDLKDFITLNKSNQNTINFANPEAVKALNKALLFKHYRIKFWDFPDDNLCPPIPGRVDYIHYLNDLLTDENYTKTVKVIDIGTGATSIYPLLGHAEYNWNFVATDIDVASLQNAKSIIQKNNLVDAIELRHQNDNQHILKGIIKASDAFALSMCNLPFYKNEAEANAATERKLKGLKSSEDNFIRNFSGTPNELIYKGGEKAFLHNYIYESSQFKAQCMWFTTLVSKRDLIKGLKASLVKLGATKTKVISMGQGQKVSRILAWTFN
ncbi:23S rRNA methyltransferase [Tamlana nanhaiensis]|uniref:Ribosomal RNA large subunit methyltransferase F n=2 Tax=Neotamlana nanhaiensis TaxID=1382798 RepID=A0A0D7WAL6_9FLAO|nr:23S rRNA methyltransferase [Tamlana nanhaiensis]